MRISDWSSDVCSSDLSRGCRLPARDSHCHGRRRAAAATLARLYHPLVCRAAAQSGRRRSEEHTSELQSLMRISYAVFCLKKKKQKKTPQNENLITQLLQTRVDTNTPTRQYEIHPSTE